MNEVISEEAHQLRSSPIKGSKTSRAAEFKAELCTSEYEAIEREFRDVIRELEEQESNSDDVPPSEETLARFRIEHEKLFRALKRSYEQEKRLIKKCKGMDGEIVNGVDKLDEVSKRLEQERRTINVTREDAEKAWSLVNAGKGRDAETSATIERLKEEVRRLEGQVDEVKVESRERAGNLELITQDRDDTRMRLDGCTKRIGNLEKDMKDAYRSNEQIQEETERMKRKNENLTKQCTARDDELKTGRIELERLVRDLEVTESKFKLKTTELVDAQFSYTLDKNRFEKVSKELQECTKQVEYHLSKSEASSQQIQELNGALDDQMEKTNIVSSDLQKSQQESKLEKASQLQTLLEKNQFQRKYEVERKRIIHMEKVVEDTKSSSHTLRGEVEFLRSDLDKSKKGEEESLRKLCILEREINQQRSKNQSTEQREKVAQEETSHKEHTIYSLGKDLVTAKEEIGKLRLRVCHLEKIRDKMFSEETNFQITNEENKRQVKILGTEVRELKKQILETEHEIKEKDQACKGLRDERGLVSRQFVDSQREVKDLESQISILRQDIQQLQNEITVKDEKLLRKQYDERRERVEKDHTTVDVSRLREQIGRQDELIQKQESAAQRLGSVIQQMDEDILNQKREYDTVLNERDILGTQLIRRNDELALLYEKVKIQGNTLKKGELQYNKRIEDMRLLMRKIKNLRMELSVAKGSSVDVDGVTRELMQTDKELLKEKIKVKVLSEELENPLNVHRWRMLEASDPDSFELIRKVQLLQKRLIKKNEEVSNDRIYILSKSSISFTFLLIIKIGLSTLFIYLRCWRKAV